MTTVYLHIGIPKTGTTTIQNFLFKNKENLLQHGILYPISGISLRSYYSQWGQQNLCWALNKECKAYDSNAGDWEDLHREIENNNIQSDLSKVLISGEAFSKLNYKQISILKAHLSKYETKVIVYLRKQDDYFLSSYCQNIKLARYWDNPRKYIQKEIEFGKYYKWLEYWKNIFGKQNLIVRVFDKSNLNGGLINDFFTAINLNLNEFELSYFKTSKNFTPSIKLIKIMRLLNEIYVGKLHRSRMNIKKLYEHTVLIPGNPISGIVSNFPDSLISPELLTIQVRQYHEM